MAYIGRPLNAGNLAVQSGTGDGSDTTPIATLDYSVGSSNSIAVYLDGVRQLAGTDFTASGTTLTFTTAPANGVGIDVYFLGLELSIPTPADATVTTAKIAANAVDETKLKDALVADFTEVVVTASDSILLGDATDSGNTKRDTVQGVLDLVPAGGTLATLGTPVAATSGTAIDFTSLPSGIKRITLMIHSMSTSGTNHVIIHLGDSGGFETGSYIGNTVNGAGTDVGDAAAAASGIGLITPPVASRIYEGNVVFTALDASGGKAWSAQSIMSDPGTDTWVGGHTKDLSGELTQIRLTTKGGSDTFDAGTVNIMYEV